MIPAEAASRPSDPSTLPSTWPSTWPSFWPSTWLWIALVGIASLALSRAFACAMPFAALASLAAFTLRRRDGVVLVLFAWVANQAVGFGLLHYPHTASTIGWGLAIGVAAVAALAASTAVTALAASEPVGRRAGGSLWSAPLGLVAAFGAYELVLFAATWLLPSGANAFAAGVMLRIFAINAVALGLLIAARRVGAVLDHATAPRTRPSH